MALSQNIGVLNPGDLYTITAKLTQGELSLHADDQIIAKIRYGFGTSIILESGDTTTSLVTPTVREQLNVTFVISENQVSITAIGANGIEYSSGQITHPDLVTGSGLTLRVRDYFTNFYSLIFGDTVFFDDVVVRVDSEEQAPVNQDRYFVYGPSGLLLGEYDSQNQPLLEHVYLGSTPIAVMKGEDVYDVHTDHLGTPRVVSSSEGDVVWSWESKPFGDSEPVVGVGVDSLPFVYNLRFPGQYFDAESGLHYNWNRSYDPETGRYLESDPIGLGGGLNTHGHAGGNPLSFFDPYGLDIEIINDSNRTISDALSTLESDPRVSRELKDKIKIMRNSGKNYKIRVVHYCDAEAALPDEIWIDPDLSLIVPTIDGGRGMIETPRILAHEIVHLTVDGHNSIPHNGPSSSDAAVDKVNDWMSRYDGINRAGYGNERSLCTCDK